MTNGFFITGTDTSVGKTYVATQIIKAFRQRDYSVSGFKPVASGGVWVDDRLENEDAQRMMRESNVDLPYSTVNPYCFEPAIAPHLAAQKNAVEINASRIQSSYAEHVSAADVIIVEGAGGWKVPLGGRLGFDDVALALALPVVLVVGLKLGCINHALLSEAAILHKKCRIAGWIGNNLNVEFGEAKENMLALQERMEAPCIGYFEHQSIIRKNSKLRQENITKLLDYLVKFR